MESAEAKAFYESCSECGGQVHRIARKCKHCGADRVPRVEDPEPEPEPAPPPPPVEAVQAVEPPPAPRPDPAPASAPPTRSSRRWMLAGAGVLILAVGMALGILIERGSHSEARSTASKPYVEVASPQPDDPDPPDTDPGITFNWSFRTSPPIHRGPPDPGGGMPVDEFVSQLGNELCSKVTNCANADPAVGILCRTIASNIQTDDVADKIESGECDYDPDSAATCVRGLQRLDCSTDSTSDPLAMMMTVDSIMSCLDALHCTSW